jgi:hypothetical protein
MRAPLMRQQASDLRTAGDRGSAEALERKARLQQRFGHGQDIARLSRFTPSARATRQQAYRQALTETAGMHALERDALTQQIGTDEARLPTIARDLALAGSTGGGTTTLHQEQQTITQRLAANRARLQAIAPREDGTPARATRQAATALANERLAPGLRSTTYAARISAGSGSAFARRITGGPSQNARYELAQTRAHAVRVAQTPPDQRAPVAPVQRARRRSAMDRPTGAGALHPAASRSTNNGETDAQPQSEPVRLRRRRGLLANGQAASASPQAELARPTRARSSTIQHLRQQQIRAVQQGNGSSSDPIPRDTPRPPRRGDEPAERAPATDRAPRFASRRRTRREASEDE